MNSIGIDHYLVFLTAGILLNITPGADTIYILSRSIAQGKPAGIASVLGIGSGGIFHTVCAAFGLSILLAQSSLLFNIVKLIGAAYLAYMGLTMLIGKTGPAEISGSSSKKETIRRIYFQGLITNVTNPKVALFFISFLPQFVSVSNTHGSLPFLILGLTFITTGSIWCVVLAVSAAFISRKLRENPVISKVMLKLCGCMFVGLCVQLALKHK